MAGCCKTWLIRPWKDETVGQSVDVDLVERARGMMVGIGAGNLLGIHSATPTATPRRPGAVLGARFGLEGIPARWQ